VILRTSLRALFDECDRGLLISESNKRGFSFRNVDELEEARAAAEVDLGMDKDKKASVEYMEET